MTSKSCRRCWNSPTGLGAQASSSSEVLSKELLKWCEFRFTSMLSDGDTCVYSMQHVRAKLTGLKVVMV